MFLKMKPLKAVTLFYASLIAVDVVAGNCPPAEEGTQHNISCAFNVSAIGPNFRLFWTAQINQTYTKTVATCSFGKCDMTPGFQAEVHDTQSVLTIGNVSRVDPFNANTKWRCEDSRDVCGPLQVYYRPREVKCVFPPVNTSRDTLSMLCTTDRVYPLAYFQVSISSDQDNFKRIIGRTSCNNSPRNETPVYYSSKCSISIALSHLRTGDNYIKINVFPDVNNGYTFAGKDSEVYKVTLSLNHHGSTPEVITSLYLVIILGVVLVVIACTAVFLGVTTFFYRRKCQNLERLKGTKSTKQQSKDTPTGYNSMDKTPGFEQNELYEEVAHPPPRSKVRANKKSSDNVYGNA